MASKEHLYLAEFIKSVHQDLRLGAKNVGVEEAWKNHCKQYALLKKYAAAMQNLATLFWDKNNKSQLSRIEWVVEKSVCYFQVDMNIQMNKELELAEKHSLILDCVNMKKFKAQQLKLLDVGSCYNPFKNFPMFDVTAVDLCPANEFVEQCDFLESTVKDEPTDIPRGVFQAEHYDIVVFSLLLEYLPDPVQRYKCCCKAFEVLRWGGVLFILTPDSKHATANSALMKTWRICLSSLGFTRVYYEKLKHLHCMMFRKMVVKELAIRWYNLKKNDLPLPAQLLSIPQDFNRITEDQVIRSQVYSREDIANGFETMPLTGCYN